MRTLQSLLISALLLAILLTAGCTGAAEEQSANPDWSIGSGVVPILVENVDVPQEGVAVVVSCDSIFSAKLRSSQEEREISGENETIVIPLRHEYTGDVDVTVAATYGSIYTSVYVDGRRVAATASSFGAISYSTTIGGVK